MKYVATEAAMLVDCAVIDDCASGSFANAGFIACRSCSLCSSDDSPLTAGIATPYSDENSVSDACRLLVPGADC